MVKEKVRKKPPASYCLFLCSFYLCFYVTPCDMFLGKIACMLWEKMALFQGKNGPEFSPFLEFIMHVLKLLS